MAIHIGISGWRYEGWRGVFYPKGLRQASELAYASRAVDTIEINGSHYSLQTIDSYRSWHDAVADWPYTEDVTADFLYLRLHGSGARRRCAPKARRPAAAGRGRLSAAQAALPCRASFARVKYSACKSGGRHRYDRCGPRR